MDQVNYFKDLIEPITDYRKIVSRTFSFKHDVDLLSESGYLKTNNLRLCKQFEKFIVERCEDYLDYIKCQEESIIGEFLYV